MQSLKIIGISVWVFVNLTLLGLFVYLYLLWSVYWRMAGGNSSTRGPVLETSILKVAPGYSPWQGRLASLQMGGSGSLSDVGRPRYFWNDTVMVGKLAPLPTDKLRNKIETYRNQLIVKLRQSQLDAANVLNVANEENNYNVQYQGDKVHHHVTLVSDDRRDDEEQQRRLVCNMARKVKMLFLSRETEPFKSLGLGEQFPSDAGDDRVWSAVHYNSCAVVSSAGSLHKSQLGNEIDSHDAVLRFNSAPTDEHERDVGTKTTFRILNSQVVSKPEFEFLESPLYQNVTLFTWDPSNYTVDVDEWYRHPDFDIFTSYFKHRQLYPYANIYILHPKMIWNSWSYLQDYTSVPVMRHPPSSGFLGLIMMAHLCYSVDFYEYIPSMRMTKRCHYFDIHENMGCTFGDWHPLASEKLLALSLNSGSDMDVFDVGKVHVRGISSCDCDVP